MSALLLVGFAPLIASAVVDDVKQGPTPVSVGGATSTTEVATESQKRPVRFRRVAVYDLQLDGVDPRVGRFVTDSLVVELRKLDGISVVAMDEVRAMLEHEAQKQLVGCSEGGTTCKSDIGDALGADEILVGTLSTAAGSSVITLRRIDQIAAKAMATVTQRLKPENGEEFLAEVGPAVDKLFPGHALRSGQTRGVPPEAAKKLNPPPLPLWAPIATGAGALVVLAGAAGVGIAALNEETAQNALIEEAKTRPVPGSLVVAAGERATGYALAANVLYGTAAVVGLAAVAMIPFTNFNVGETE